MHQPGTRTFEGSRPGQGEAGAPPRQREAALGGGPVEAQPQRVRGGCRPS